MVGMGMVRKMIFSYVGNPGVGLLRRVRDAVENGWPHPIEIEEHSHAAMANAWQAQPTCRSQSAAIAAPNLPVSTRTSNPSNAHSPAETGGCAGASSMSLSSMRRKPTRKGNVLVEGIVGVQKEAVLAAKRAVVTVEEVVENFDDLHPNLTVLPHWTLSAIAVVPGGASSPSMVITATMPPIWNGMRLPPTASASAPGWKRT